MRISTRFFVSFIALGITIIPTLLFLGGRSLVSPEGFLQNFFVLGRGTYFLFGAQFVFAVIFFGTLFFIWKRW